MDHPLRRLGMDAERSTQPAASRRVEILLDDDLYQRVRIKAMQQRVSLRSVGARLFARWVEAGDATD
jgi:hypothetical protein